MGHSRALPWASAATLLLVLASLGASGQPVAPTAALQPTYRGTAGLEAVVAALRAVAERGEWQAVGPIPLLRLGDQGPAVAWLRERLAATGEAPSVSPPAPLLFDQQLEQAVLGFQDRHGLAADGVVGPATRRELDLSPRDRVRQAERTIAARRALPVDLPGRFLLLNLPAFEMEAFAAGQLALTLRVIVGSANQPTPIMVSEVRSLLTHPPWNIPARIARHEIAPRLARDAGYLARLGIDVFAAASSEPIAPAAIDWEAFERGDLDLVLRQRPGPENALGAVSFQAPNPFNICLHDTADRRLFERTRRDLSHGCVRVDRALDLARWLLEEAPVESRQRLEEALAGGRTETWILASPVPLYIVDWPVWVDAAGVLQMRPELYDDSP
jgi:L,D-transpeptidase YcbB